MNSHATSRLQPRQGPNTAYDRVINNSQFNQPLNDRSYQTIQDPQARPPQQRMYDQGPSQFSRSNEDLLSSFPDSMRYSGQPQFTSLIPPTFGSGFRPESDFLQSSKYTSPLRRSFDALNDFADMQQSFPTQRQYPSEHPQQQQQQQQQPYYRSSYQTQHQPQPQQQQYQQQPTYSNQTYFNPNIVYTNEYGVPTDQHPPNTFQERGQFCKYNSLDFSFDFVIVKRRRNFSPSLLSPSITFSKLLKRYFSLIVNREAHVHFAFIRGDRFERDASLTSRAPHSIRITTQR